MDVIERAKKFLRDREERLAAIKIPVKKIGRPRRQSLRDKVLELYGPECMKCGSSENPTIDHIRPRSRFPDLVDDIDNLQVLCNSCNSAKGIRTTDYRNPPKIFNL